MPVKARTGLESATKRLRLAPRRQPYLARIEMGKDLAYRRCRGPGSWSTCDGGASDSELLAEAIEDNEDPDRTAAAMRNLFDETESEAGKAKMAAARAALEEQRRRPAGVFRLDAATASRRLQKALADNPETARKLTLAARKGEKLSDNDVIGMLEDLEELGILLPGDEDGKQ
jgi:hypothetical protein